MTFKPNALNTSNYVCLGQEIEDCNERAEESASTGPKQSLVGENEAEMLISAFRSRKSISGPELAGYFFAVLTIFGHPLTEQVGLW